MSTKNTIQLQSILFPTEAVCNVPEVYYHVSNDKKRVDFDGYFNLFAVDKWRKYTVIDNLFLKLTCSGYNTLVLMNERQEIGRVNLEPDRVLTYEIEFPYTDESYGLVFWFSLIRGEKSEIIDGSNESADVKGYFFSKTDDYSLREINIAADICTFKREPYVYRNLLQLKEMIFDRSELDVSSHFEVFVIDNGKTLKDNADITGLIKGCGGRIKVFENKNAGGAGGFTRGMIEAIRAKDSDNLTHVLLMDDDAINEPDAIVRLYGLLTTLRYEWKGTAVGGSMMREDFPFVLYENGAAWKKDDVIRYREKNDIRIYDNAVADYVMKPYGEHERFSGWWFYCVPLTTVRKDNLPLPVFIHMDDIEYGIRNEGSGIIFLNGIGVWHRAFDLNDATMNVYTYARNGMIMTSLHTDNGLRRFGALKNLVFKPLVSYVIRYRYTDIDVIRRAVDDYFKGPGYIMKTDPETILKEISSAAVRFKPVEEWADKLTPEEMQLVKETIDGFDSGKLLDSVLEYRSTGSPKYVYTLNGWLLPAKNKLKVISCTESPVKLFRYKKAAIFEPYSGKIFVGEKDFSKVFYAAWVYLTCCLKVILKNGRMTRKYRKAFPVMTSMKFWEKYLGC